jgi:hypothetical protein
MSVGSKLHRLVPAALCSLGAHAVLYRSLWPTTGGHAYFAWYEPLVAGLSLATLLVFGVIGLAALGSRDRSTRLFRLVGLVLPAASRPEPVSTRTRRLALASLAFLIFQESCERMAAAHAPVLAPPGAGEILTVLGVLAFLAWVLALAERSCVRLVELVLDRERAGVTTARVPPAAPSRSTALRRRRALADLCGLRAPPLPA